jgi:hypothetical protein
MEAAKAVPPKWRNRDGYIDDAGPGPIAVDTAPFIYRIEEHDRYLLPLLPLFEAADGVTLLLTDHPRTRRRLASPLAAQRQPSPGATYRRIDSMTCAL